MSKDKILRGDDLVVEAEPEKALFVDMLTRDIDLIPAIMDLIDNSIDGARARIDDPSDGEDFWVEITVANGQFEIRDNCGGIDIDTARKYAFRFGRPGDYKGTKRSVGQFGVGMKRALFKLGSKFTVESRASDSQFKMTVNVPEWVADPSPVWTFKMSEAARDQAPDGAVLGTIIRVAELYPSIQEDLASDAFLSLLREQIRFRHQEALAEKIRISLNGSRLQGLTTELLDGEAFHPINRSFVVASDEGDVAVRIIAGITKLERREIGKDEDDPESFRGGVDAGWWIFCNDRLLLMRERTRLTGWGENLPNYHPQYRQFRGYVFMSAASTAALPWNTTKTGIDEDSRVWRQVQAQIKIAGSEVVSVLNRLKTEERQAAGEGEMPTVLAAGQAQLTSTRQLPPSEKFEVPPLRRETRKRKARAPKVKKLQFDVLQDRFEEVAQSLGTSVVAEVGRRTFEYYYEREIED